MPIYLSVATEMRIFRNAHNFSITSFSKRLGVSQATVSSYENGVRPIPIKAIEKYAEWSQKDRALLVNRLKFEDYILNLITSFIYNAFSDIALTQLNNFLSNILNNEIIDNWNENMVIYDSYVKLCKTKKQKNINNKLEYERILITALHRDDAKWFYKNIPSIKHDASFSLDYILSWPPNNFLLAPKDKSYQIENKIQLLDLFFMFFKSINITDDNSENDITSRPFNIILKDLGDETITL